MKFWKNQSIRRKEVSFFLAMVLFGVLKEFLVYNLPIMAVPKGIHDDWIMVHMADALRKGQWLGEYNDLTLTKGMFFPFYLAVLNFLRLSYLSVSALLYTVSCMIFVYALRPLLKKYWACFTLYLVLLWNPVSYSVQAFQRVYRNSISYIQVLLIFGGLLALWLRRKEPVKKQILWLLTAAVGMVTFFYTREDAIWVEPFLLVFLLVYLGTMFFSWKKEHRREYVGKAVLVLLPFLSVWGAGQLIAQENDNHYNIRLTNELQKGGFAEMYKSMMAVKPEEDIPGVTMTREKIARMCDECPTLEKLEPYIQSSRLYWAGSGEMRRTGKYGTAGSSGSFGQPSRRPVTIRTARRSIRCVCRFGTSWRRPWTRDASHGRRPCHPPICPLAGRISRRSVRRVRQGDCLYYYL